MKLCEWFAEASSSRSVNTCSLEKDKHYLIMRVERLSTKYRIAIILMVKALSTDAMCVFLVD